MFVDADRMLVELERDVVAVGIVEVDIVEVEMVLVELLPSRLSDLGAGGAKYDFRLWRSIIETAHSARSTGVCFAAFKKPSLSYSSRGVGRSSGFFIRHLAIKLSKITGKASHFGSFGAGSWTMVCRRSRMPIGPALSLSPAAESDASNGNRPIASSITVKPTLQTSDLMEYAPPCIRSGAMYVDVPTNVSATELTVSVATPKSHNLIMPLELTRTFDGLISRCIIRCASYKYTRPPRIDSVILPRTSTRTGPKSFDIRSRDLLELTC